MDFWVDVRHQTHFGDCIHARNNTVRETVKRVAGGGEGGTNDEVGLLRPKPYKFFREFMATEHGQWTCIPPPPTHTHTHTH